MKTKSIAMIVIFNFLIISSTCSSMDYMRGSYNSAAAMVANNMMYARNWTSNFIKRCWNVSVLATIYATFGIYDFKKITRLDENKLNTYNPRELDKAMNQVKTMIKYGGWSQELDNFFHKIQANLFQATSDEEAAADEKKMREEIDLSYDEEAALAYIQELMSEKK